MGGLIVWGIEAKKNADGIDCATALTPIADIERFKGDVTRLLSQALMATNEGIFVETIPAQNPPRAGYLAIYVERSERRPHRCKFTKQYWKRSGDSSIMMEHFEIEESFKRLVVPWLEVEWSVGPHPSNDPSMHRLVAIEIHIRNPSPVTGRFPYLTLPRVQGARVEEQTLFNPYEAGRGYHKHNGEHHFLGGRMTLCTPGFDCRSRGL